MQTILIVTTAYLICAFLINYNNIIHTTLFTYFYIFYLYYFLLLVYASHLTINQSVAQDWLVVLPDGNTDWLTNTNAVMNPAGFLLSYSLARSGGCIIKHVNIVVYLTVR